MTYHSDLAALPILNVVNATTAPMASGGFVKSTAILPVSTVAAARPIAIEVALAAKSISPSAPGKVIADAITKASLTPASKSVANFVALEIASTTAADVIANAMASLDVTTLRAILTKVREAATSPVKSPTVVAMPAPVKSPPIMQAPPVVYAKEIDGQTKTGPMPGDAIVPKNQDTAYIEPGSTELLPDDFFSTPPTSDDSVMPSDVVLTPSPIAPVAGDPWFKKVPIWVWVGGGVLVVGGIAYVATRKKSVVPNRRRRRR